MECKIIEKRASVTRYYACAEVNIAYLSKVRMLKEEINKTSLRVITK
ncbi:hypothetical protein [Tenacibaculum sp. 47A_GOM-205m]|nr:hypothetical protein [Tenacibaculum sp. 47A_GOM-205m]